MHSFFGLYLTINANFRSIPLDRNTYDVLLEILLSPPKNFFLVSLTILSHSVLSFPEAAEIRVSSLDHLSLIVESITPSKYGPKYAVKEKTSDDENDEDDDVDPDVHDRSSGPEESP